ncbi:MAG: N-acetylmuramoyl-L-alanine amidase [Candidatus Caenarcaniphilales bacterium]|nr:N-acetylmuramoyl-L-alanine amidase [Candidatus Caenarcaniphilales bacterium]
MSIFHLDIQAADKKITVKNVSLKHGILKIPHNSFSTIKFAKKLYSEPDRLVFDIYNAELKGKNKTFKLDNGPIEEVKVAQFQEEVVRIVIESKDRSLLHKIKIDNIGQTIYFNLSVNLTKVEDVRFKNGNLYIEADHPINVRSLILEKPERLVIDLIGAYLRSSSLKVNLSTGYESIKVSQFNKSTVRIVLAGAKDYEQREIKLSSNERELCVVGPDSDDVKVVPILKDKLLNLNLIDRKDKGTVFIVESSKEIDYKFLYLKKPERFVVDIIDVAFEESLRSNQFKETQFVANVRFGLATLGKPVTRIVFDLKKNDLKADIIKSSSKKSLTIVIAPNKPDNNSKEKSAELVNESQAAKEEESGLDLSGIPAHKNLQKKVVIDAGHGGYDPGASYGGHDEKDITLAISRKVKAILEAKGVKAYLTRSEDRFISLAERVEISKSISPNLFVSVHVNAIATNPAMDGLQTYYYSSNGYKVAKVMHKELLDQVKMPNRNIRKAAFWVCKYTKAPSVLLELGFMTNKKERKKIVTEDYQDKLAKAIASGIIKYINQ